MLKYIITAILITFTLPTFATETHQETVDKLQALINKSDERIAKMKELDPEAYAKVMKKYEKEKSSK